ncbi:helix-turn-helix domain-containing protein [Chryseobacterium sp. JJR-5R]|uniref:helix-turn-helix domain-containing protein n=1 Tax=Chryseobacterium sp. JJR-5R TaxID=3093923 RepID=UPI002A755050|nr:helix-turn-helix domain-containing protein [Chryseobacterium sp. JJR-5R]WPO83315.1 helix-turn-helix domain-containing protein [Chryseobacterium sp. JJR-5R]
MKKNKMSLGVKLRNLRHTKNLSQAEIADRLRVSQPAYHLWETDQAKPTTENLLRISEIYNLDLYSLLDTQDQNIINNSTFQDNSSVQQQYYPTINNMAPPELLESVIKNQQQITLQQEQITQLIQSQNKLIESLLKK